MAGVGNLYRAEVCFFCSAVAVVAGGLARRPGRAVTLAHTLLLRNAHRPEQSTTGELAGAASTGLPAGRPAVPRCGTRIQTGEQGDASTPASPNYCPRLPTRPAPAPIAAG